MSNEELGREVAEKYGYEYITSNEDTITFRNKEGQEFTLNEETVETQWASRKGYEDLEKDLERLITIVTSTATSSSDAVNQ